MATTKDKLKAYGKSNDSSWDQYEESVLILTAKIFQKEIRPWLDKKGYQLITGMGSWGIWNNDQLLYDYQIPDKVHLFLDMCLEGHQQSVGSLLDSYNPEA